MKKLTLSMEEGDIRAARELAKTRRTSISKLFSEIVRVMARRQGLDKAALPPRTRSALGLIKLPKRASDRKLVEDALLDRHGFKK